MVVLFSTVQNSLFFCKFRRYQNLKKRNDLPLYRSPNENNIKILDTEMNVPTSVIVQLLNVLFDFMLSEVNEKKKLI